MTTEEQRALALKKANRVRVANAALKRDVASGRVDWRDVLRNPPDHAESMRVAALLATVAGVGPMRADAAMRHAGVIPTKRLGSLTANQARALCALGKHLDAPGRSGPPSEVAELRRQIWSAQRENDRLSRALERMHNERVAMGLVAA